MVSFYSSKLKLRASLEYEKKEKKQIEELNQSKLRFFTIYHMNSVLAYADRDPIGNADGAKRHSTLGV